MNNLQRLNKKVLDAQEAYEKFKNDNSRELTDEELEKETESSLLPIQPMINWIEQPKPRIFELTMEKVNEMKKLEQNVRDAQSNYVEEYKKIKTK